MRTTCKGPHWTVIATLSVLTAVGCRATVAPNQQTGAQGVAAGTGVVATAGRPGTAAGAPSKPGTTAGTGTSTGSSSAGVSGSATMTGSSNGSQASAGEGGSDAASTQTSTSTSGSSGSDASAAAGTSGAAPMKPKNPNAIPACEGKNNEGACDGAKLYYCIDEAPDGAGQSCMSAVLCQLGIKSGKCGECEPGKFKCEGKELQKCDDTGQWKLENTCESELLCKETMGKCDDKVCSEGEYDCDGDNLQVCNKDLTAFMTEKTCMPGLCNAAAKKCNECNPMVMKECASQSELALCSMDGMKTSMACPNDKKYCVMDKKDCFECTSDADCGMSMNECGTRACRDNKCVDGTPKPRGTKCSTTLLGGAGVCNFTGTCVGCITDADCNNPELRCIPEVQCTTRNAIEATSLLGSWTVTVSAGYEVTVDSSKVAVSITSGLATAGTILGGSKTESRTYTIRSTERDIAACNPLFPKIGRDNATIRLEFGNVSKTETDPMTGMSKTTLACTADQRDVILQARRL